MTAGSRHTTISKAFVITAVTVTVSRLAFFAVSMIRYECFDIDVTT